MKRLINTSAGPVEFDVTNREGRLGLNVVVTAFDQDGWEAGHQHWNDTWSHRAPEDERTFPQVLQKAARIPEDEAERIASQLMAELPQHPSPEKPRSERRKVTAWLALTFALAALGMLAAIVGAVWLGSSLL